MAKQLKNVKTTGKMPKVYVEQRWFQWRRDGFMGCGRGYGVTLRVRMQFAVKFMGSIEGCCGLLIGANGFWESNCGVLGRHTE